MISSFLSEQWDLIVLSSVSFLASPSRSSLDYSCAAHLKTGKRQTSTSWPVMLAFVTCWLRFQAWIFVLIPLQSTTRRCFLYKLEKLPSCLPLYSSFCCVTHKMKVGAGILVTAHHTICLISFPSLLVSIDLFFLSCLVF